jgi:hypothetical protein
MLVKQYLKKSPKSKEEQQEQFNFKTMKRFFLLLMLLPILSFSQNKKKDCDCKVPKFEHLFFYVQSNSGAGIEFGTWPQKDKFGFILGTALTYERGTIYNNIKSPNNINPYTTLDIHFKTIYRLHRFFYLVGTAGIVNVMSGMKSGDDMNNPYIAGGLRISIPFSSGTKWAFIAEPQYGTRGGNLLLGVAIAL